MVSQIARVEVPAALWRKQRSGELDVDSASVLVLAFEADYFGTEDEPPRCTAFAAFDRTVRAAAAAEGFGLVPVTQLARTR
ncbi:MAG: hypothetical protein ACRDRK_01100 [Pseudonocardia sp.]